MLLLDTSAWIEYFSPKSKLSIELLNLLEHSILENDIVINHVIRAELLSGGIRKGSRKEFETLISTIQSIDLDWNNKEIWDEVIHLAEIAYSKKLPIPGLVDRMILLSAQKAQVQLFTLDQALLKLAKHLDIAALQ